MTLKVKVYTLTEKGKDKEEIGHFYIPTRADLEWLKRNVPFLVRAAQVMGNDLPEEELGK